MQGKAFGMASPVRTRLYDLRENFQQFLINSKMFKVCRGRKSLVKVGRTPVVGGRDFLYHSGLESSLARILLMRVEYLPGEGENI